MILMLLTIQQCLGFHILTHCPMTGFSCVYKLLFALVYSFFKNLFDSWGMKKFSQYQVVVLKETCHVLCVCVERGGGGVACILGCVVVRFSQYTRMGCL